MANKSAKVKEISTKAKTSTSKAQSDPELDETSEDAPETLRSKYARAAVQVRWATEKATDEEVREHVRKLDRHAMMTYLDKLRHACEVVAQEVNQRLCEETPETVCQQCRGPKKGGQWRLIRPIPNRKLGTIENVYFCSDICIVRYNQEQTGIAGIPDRGMSRGSAMPNEVPARTVVDRNVAMARKMADETNADAKTMPDRTTLARVAAKSNKSSAHA